MSANIIEDFITGFQFLTRIHIVTQSDWSLDSFGRSVKFFPVIGAIIGMILAGVVYGIQNFIVKSVPIHGMAVMVIVAEILITGGLHCDGFMDTVDGVFSGRSRERMLEIMKDSRVGAFGVIAFCLLVLCKYSLILDIEPAVLPIAVLVMPIVGRIGLVLAITLYPYAKEEGLGKIFYQPSHRTNLCVAGVLAMLLIVPLGKKAIISCIAGLGAAFIFCQYVSKRLGGLTGDAYGGVNELTEFVALLVFVF